MPALSERKIDIVRTLVSTAPDKVVGGLEAALAETGQESALAAVRRLVETEARERRVRNLALQPLAPLCVGDGRSTDRLTFPARALSVLWRGLGKIDPEGVEAARHAYDRHIPGESSPEPFDRLTQAAAAAMEFNAAPEFDEAAALCAAARPGGDRVLLACLKVAPIVRAATLRLPEWLSHLDHGSGAAARLAYKDAVSIVEDAGAWFFEMLAAQMAHPWMILRVISEVMDKPSERYLADSEMAVFCERLLSEVDETLRSIAAIDPKGGAAGGRAAGRLVERVTHQLAEMETCIELSRDHGWGARIHKQRQSLASVVEGRFREAEKYAKDALPNEQVRINRIRRDAPRLSEPPDPARVEGAMTLLTFVHETRGSANYGGFASARTKLLETLSAYIDLYVEEVLDLLKTGDAESDDNAHAYLNVAAELNGLVQGEKAAELVRRRTVAAGMPEPPLTPQA